MVKREADGKLEIQKATDHSTKSGLKWGLVGGIALGVIFPPSILGSAAALGAAGAATGKIRQLHHRSELADELEDRSPRVTRGSSRSSPIPAWWRSARHSRGRRHRRGRDRRRRCPRHQGRSQGSRSRGRLVADRHAPTTPSPGVVWSWSALGRGLLLEHPPPPSPSAIPSWGR